MRHFPLYCSTLFAFNQVAAAHKLPAHSDLAFGERRQEFKSYVEKKEKIVRGTFAKLDVDNSGYIDADELVGVVLPQVHIIGSADGSTWHSFNVQYSAEGVKLSEGLTAEHCASLRQRNS